MEIEDTITEVARKYGVTPTQVKKDIGEAIRIGMASKDPTVRQWWKKISHNRCEPTVEEVIAFIALEIKANNL